jgi:hypothetical protein
MMRPVASVVLERTRASMKSSMQLSRASVIAVAKAEFKSVLKSDRTRCARYWSFLYCLTCIRVGTKSSKYILNSQCLNYPGFTLNHVKYRYH